MSCLVLSIDTLCSNTRENIFFTEYWLLSREGSLPSKDCIFTNSKWSGNTNYFTNISSQLHSLARLRKKEYWKHARFKKRNWTNRQDCTLLMKCSFDGSDGSDGCPPQLETHWQRWGMILAALPATHNGFSSSLSAPNMASMIISMVNLLIQSAMHYIINTIINTSV